jgi:hypothetical protein
VLSLALHRNAWPNGALGQSPVLLGARLLTLVAAASQLPGRPAVSTVWRWCVHGIATRDGSRVRLPHRRLGRRVYVTEEDLDQFARELAERAAEALGTCGGAEAEQG